MQKETQKVLFDGFNPARGARIGLLGGSFDPPHLGHVHISQAALKRFGLDRVIWLVSPGNPLKKHAPATIEARIEQAKRLDAHPRVFFSDVEARIGTRFTAETLDVITRRYRDVRFTWLMGADNLAQFHLWEKWQHIAATMPIGVLARPRLRLPALTSPAARIMRHARLPEAASHLLPLQPAPSWCFLNLPLVGLSSTELRKKRSA